MDLKLFASTFALIFIAELGDKTQLAALAQSVNGRWTVFLAASSALVLSTLIAVLVGEGMARLVPPLYLKLFAGALFIIIGFFMLRSAIKGKAEAAEAIPASGIVAALAVKTAAFFEKAAAADYLTLAAQTKEGEMRALFTALAREEEAHLARLQALGHAPRESAATEQREVCPALRYLVHDVAADEESGRETAAALRHAIAHEEATARFYRGLAAEAGLPSLRAVFAALAVEEERHVDRLRQLIVRAESVSFCPT